MSFDSEALQPMHEDLFAVFGSDANVRRAAEQKPVRVIVNRGVERYGSNGEVIGTVSTMSFLLSEWTPKNGDEVTVGDWERKVDVVIKNDGFVAEAVMHG